MTLEEFLVKNLTRSDPHPALDFALRAEKHPDGTVSFYIHASGRDSDTLDFYVEGNELFEKRLS